MYRGCRLQKLPDDGALGAKASLFADKRVRVVLRANGWFVWRRCWLLKVLMVVLSLVLANLINVAEVPS